jgi:FkbM family methyltransferase
MARKSSASKTERAPSEAPEAEPSVKSAPEQIKSVSNPVVAGLRPFLHPSSMDAFDAAAAQLVSDDETLAWSTLLPAMIAGSDLMLSRRMRFVTRATLAKMLDKILVRQELFFETKSEAPLIVDAGANIGLATYFFKRIFHNCRIVALEPNPKTAETFKLNISRNGYTDVEFVEAALSDASGSVPFWVSASDSGSSSLVHARAPSDAQVVSVPGVSLRDLLREPVAFLKLDIVGSEATVLRDAKEKLGLVDQIYCECYPSSKGNNLTEVLSVLASAGFHTAVGPSLADEGKRRFRAGTAVKKDRQYTVFARRSGLG